MTMHNASVRRRIGRRLPALAGAAVLVLTVAAPVAAGPAHTGAPTIDPEHRPVTAWASRHAMPLDTTDPRAPLGDLAPLRERLRVARIVGLGESVHGASEETTLKHRVLRLLVERMGFRSIAWEDDWTVGRRIDRYIRTGRGDLAMILGQMGDQWQSREVAGVLRWLRRYNIGRSDKVRFVGVEYYYTRRLAYDAVDHYVARHAPGRLEKLRRDLWPIRPTMGIRKYTTWYTKQEDKQPYVRHARRVYEFVHGLPHRTGDRAYAITLHHARQIRSFYRHYAMPFADSLVYRDARDAQNLRWWKRLSGDRIVYWAASPHVVNAPHLRLVAPPYPDMRFPSAGSYLRAWYGPRYVPIGFTFDHGAVRLGPHKTGTMPPPKAGWFERPLGRVRFDQYALDLRTPAPPPVRRWLTEPVTTRGLPDAGPNGVITGGTLAQWFDLVVHRQVITPVRPA